MVFSTNIKPLTWLSRTDKILADRNIKIDVSPVMGYIFLTCQQTNPIINPML